MHRRFKRRESSAGSGLLFVVIAALLIAPALSAVALFAIAGPSTRAALAGEDPTALADLVDRSPAGSGEQLPLADLGVDDPAEALGLAPVFEPRVGRFRLSDADPGADDDAHGGRAVVVAGDE